MKRTGNLLIGMAALAGTIWATGPGPATAQQPSAGNAQTAPNAQEQDPPSAERQQAPNEPTDAPRDAQASGNTPSAGDAQAASGQRQQPTAEEIMRAFQTDRPENRPVQPRAWQPNPEGGDARWLMREGEYVHNLAGRVDREAPWWVLHVESDTTDAPRPGIRLLPNQLLERMVREIEGTDTSIVFVVSGEVTLFESQNYLLIRKALRRRTSDNLTK